MTSAPNTKKPGRLLEQTPGVVPTCEEKNVASVVEGTQQAERVPAICCECGAVRDLAKSRARRYTVELKCDNCGKTTLHAPVVGSALDWRERVNARGTDGQRELWDAVRRIEDLGSIVVEFDETDSKNTYGPTPLEVWRYEDPDLAGVRFRIIVHEDQSIEDKLTWLRRGLWWIVNVEFNGNVCRDGELRYRGHYSETALRRVTGR